MGKEERSIPLTQDNVQPTEIPPHRTDDPEWYWTALIVLVILSIVIIVLLYNHDIQDPGYSNR
jgi:hypothetical protein